MLIGTLLPIFLLISLPESNLGLNYIFNLNNLIFIFFSLIFLGIGLYILIGSILEIVSLKTSKKIKSKFIKLDNRNILFSRFLSVNYILISLTKILLALIVGIFFCLSPIIFKINTSKFIIIILFEGFGLALISISLTNFINIYENYKNNK